MQYIVRGARMVFGDRKLWPFIWRPLLISALVFLAIIVGGYFVVVPWLAAAAQSAGLDARTGGAAATVVYGVLWWFLSGVVFTAIAGIFSSFLWERLSLKVEQDAFGSAPEVKIPVGAIVMDSVMRMVFSTVICCFSVCLSWVVILGIAFGGILSLYDYTASAYLRRDILFPTQLRRVYGCKQWWQFALCCGVVSLFPFVNVILLPAFVAGGTLMVADSERVG